MRTFKIFFVFALLFCAGSGYAQEYLLHTMMAHTDNVLTADFTNDERYAYSAGYNFKTGIIKWRIDNAEDNVYLSSHTDIINSVRVNRIGDVFASASNDATVKIWSVSKNSVIKTLNRHGHYVNSVRFSGDGKQMVTAGSDNNVIVWSGVAPYSVKVVLRGHTDVVRCAVFSPNGAYVVSCSEDNTIRLWSVAKGTLLQTLQDHTKAVTSVDFSSDGKVVASASQDGTVILWDFRNNKLEKSTILDHKTRVNVVAFSPDAKILATAGRDGDVRFWGIASGYMRKEESGASVWEGVSCRYIFPLSGHRGDVNDISFSASGEKLVSVGEDNTVKVWGNFDTESLLRSIGD